MKCPATDYEFLSPAGLLKSTQLPHPWSSIIGYMIILISLYNSHCLYSIPQLYTEDFRVSRRVPHNYYVSELTYAIDILFLILVAFLRWLTHKHPLTSLGSTSSLIRLLSGNPRIYISLPYSTASKHMSLRVVYSIIHV